MRVLYADDDVVSRHILRNKLSQWGYTVVCAEEGNAAWDVLQDDDPPRLAILDWMMPGIDGFEILRRLRAQRHEPYVYVILLTSKQEKEDLIAAMDAGADDYLTKPFDPHELKVRLRAGQRIIELQEDLIQAREELRQKATHDALTGLWNRPAILDQLQRELVRSDREENPLGICMVDVDHFKNINDTYGHLTGDEVLRTISQRILACLRTYDAVARHGGDEFLIILPGCDCPRALTVAQRICRQINQEMVTIKKHSIAVTISVGVTAKKPGMRINVEDFLHVADTALYTAKANGRNRAEAAVFEPTPVTTPTTYDPDTITPSTPPDAKDLENKNPEGK